MKKILLIANPKAGKGTIQKRIPRIIENFKKQGYEITNVYTQIGYGPKEILKEYGENFDLVVCCGGDGTLKQLITGIMSLENRPQISFIPLGTMNDFAKTIKLSTKKVSKSNNFKQIKTIDSDIGSFNNKYFNYVAAFGAFTAVSYVTKQNLKKSMGKFAYFIIAAKYFKRIKPYNIEIEIDGQTYQDKVIYGAISNSKYVSGFEWFNKDTVKIDDGKFEMIFIKRPKNFFEWLTICRCLVFRKHKAKYFYFFQSDKIKIKSNHSLTWTLDGEYGGRTKEVEIKNNNKAVQFIIPE